MTCGVLWALFCKTLPLSSYALLGTYHSLRLLQRYGTVNWTISGKRMISICLRDSLRRTILKRPIATCLKLLLVYFIFSFILLTCYELCLITYQLQSRNITPFFKLECTCGIRARCGALQRLHIRKSSMNCRNLQEGVCWCLCGILLTLERKFMIRVTSKSELKFLSMSFVFSFFFFPGLLYLE